MKPATAALPCLLLGCADPIGAGPATPRAEPDDRDLVAIVPAATETLLEIDMAALRASPWTRPILESASPEERAAKREARGFDEIADVDRVVFAMVAGTRQNEATLVVAQGRFERDRVYEAFRASAPDAREEQRRGRTILRAGGRALSLVTPRTLLSGPPAAVGAALDCAFGAVPDVHSDPDLGEIRRALDRGGAAPVVRLSLIVTDDMRARIRQEIPAGDPVARRLDGLRRLAARIDLGTAFDLEALGQMSDATAAESLSRSAADALRRLRTRPELAAAGLGDLFEALHVGAGGPRVTATLHLDEESRADLGARLAALAKALGGS